MRAIFKESLVVVAAVVFTGATALAMESPKQAEMHVSSQAVQSVPEPVEPAPTPTVTEPKVEEPKPVEPVATATPEPAPEPPKPKVDSSIPARVFCGSPQQRTWKTPLLENATIGREMAAANKDWTGAQWDALLELWSCESSWNNFARNPSSAFGIAQFLDSTWSLPGMKQFNCQKTVDAREQIRCGLEYIQVVYGTPASALDYHYRNNSY